MRCQRYYTERLLGFGVTFGSNVRVGDADAVSIGVQATALARAVLGQCCVEVPGKTSLHGGDAGMQDFVSVSVVRLLATVVV